MNGTVTINGRKVRIVSREMSREAGGNGCIEALIIRGIHYDWPLGAKVHISYPEEMVRGRVTSSWTDLQKHLTHLRVHRY